ncbi:D-alanine aminotransferase [Hartmannibacter diazotrophicus]|uniref:Probable branched-chain-amino-acid aminotransferase n=1 Tax=Hartmannibacter diazotrophicus TaxID=1482074 RepID=A0A2C9D6X2_9HYPH|nr:aminotransferase class IV [Hartmannibacter diazotrophicus]SON55898.1 D-alanine aminotransferase [Hartmannibacter diazotrophicus]
MIWLNGALHEGPTIPLDATDRGLLLADGVFETLVVFHGRPFCLAEHLARLGAGARLLGFEAPLRRAEEGLLAMAAKAPEDGAVLRLTVTRGPGPRGLLPPENPTPTIMVTMAPFNPALVFQPVSMVTVGTRRNEYSPLSRIKSLAYMDQTLALKEAREAGADEALMLNTAGRPVCSSAANIFVVVKDEVLTPPVGEGVLAGITRARFLSVADLGGLKVVERPLTAIDIARASEIFLTNSVRFFQPVSTVDEKELDQNAPVAKIALDLLRDLAERECMGPVPIASLQ